MRARSKKLKDFLRQQARLERLEQIKQRQKDKNYLERQRILANIQDNAFTDQIEREKINKTNWIGHLPNLTIYEYVEGEVLRDRYSRGCLQYDDHPPMDWTMTY